MTVLHKCLLNVIIAQGVVLETERRNKWEESESEEIRRKQENGKIEKNRDVKKNNENYRKIKIEKWEEIVREGRNMKRKK